MVNINNSDEITREYIISRIERAGKDIVMYNKLLSKIKGFKSIITYYKDICEDEGLETIQPELKIILLKLENEIRAKKRIRETNLSKILYEIILSDEFRNILGIKGTIKADKYDLYIGDILDSMELLTFNNSKDISNFILAYMRKFI